MNVSIIRRAAEELGYPSLKPEQLKVIQSFVNGRDVFAVLPTGFWKSLCYTCLPFTFDKMLVKVSRITNSCPSPPMVHSHTRAGKHLLVHLAPCVSLLQLILYSNLILMVLLMCLTTLAPQSLLTPGPANAVWLSGVGPIGIRQSSFL